MPFISWKVELKLQWTENCVLAVAGKMIMLMPILVILFLISKTQNNYMSLQSHYQQKTTKNYQNILVKGLKNQFIGMNIEQKVRIKIQHNNKDIYSDQTLLQLQIVLIYSNNDDAKRFKTRRYFLPKNIKNYNAIINGKNFMMKQLILT